MAAGTKGSAAVSLTEPRLRGSIKPGSTEKLSGGGAPNCGATFGTDRTINCRSAMPRARLDRAITMLSQWLNREPGSGRRAANSSAGTNGSEASTDGRRGGKRGGKQG